MRTPCYTYDMNITPFLWFDDNAQDAAKLYTEVFPNSKIISDTSLGQDAPGTSVEVRIIEIELNGQRLKLMNAGPVFTFNESMSLLVDCDGQDEVDYYWEKLIDRSRGDGQCGWLKDKFGLSWQIIPKQMNEIMSKDTTGKATQAMLKMQKIVIADLEKTKNSN